MLGLALGTNGVLIGVLGHLFLAMPPLVREPHSIFRVQRAFSIPGRGTVVNDALSYPQYAAIAGHNSGAAQVAGSYVMSVSIGEGADSRRAAAAFVTESYFRFLGVAPEIGRTFTADESDQPSGAAVVVLGHDLWVHRFGASRGVLGRTLRVGRSTYTIIGVLPTSFHGIGERPAGLWLPLAVAGSISYGSAWDFDDGAFWIRAFVRIPRGSAPAAVAGRLSAALTPPGVHSSREARVVLAPLNAPSGRQRSLQDRVALWLGGLALAVLLIVCANIGNSFLALGIERRADTAVRLALGGSRWLLGANVLGEAMGLSACGGALGLVLAAIFSRAIAGPLRAAGVDQAAGFDGTLVVTMLALVFLVGILTSVLPLLALRERSLQPVLRSAAVTPIRVTNGCASLSWSARWRSRRHSWRERGCSCRASMRCVESIPGSTRTTSSWPISIRWEKRPREKSRPSMPRCKNGFGQIPGSPEVALRQPRHFSPVFPCASSCPGSTPCPAIRTAPCGSTV